MALLFPAGYQFADANGTPLSGGNVHFYRTGTTTDKNVYSDAALTTPIANPVVLDASGRVATNVYALEDERYTIKVDDSSDAQVWTRDDVWGVVESIAITVGTETLTPSGGDTARALAAVVSNSISLLDFGAAGDGTTDDSTALQNAMDSATYLIDGLGLTYRIDSAITRTVSTSGIRKRFRNCVFDFSNGPSSARFMNLLGTLGTGVAPTANITAGTNTVSMSSTSAYAVGQWLLFRSSDAFSSSVTNGEWNQIRSLTGSQLTMERNFHLSYTSSPLVYAPAAWEEIAFENCEIIGGGDPLDQRGINVQYAINCRYIHCKGRDFANRHFNALDYVSLICDHMVADNSDQSLGLAYGLAFGGAGDVTVITQPVGRNLRHVYTGGANTGVTFNVTAIGGMGTGLTASGPDAHPGTMYVNYIGGTWVMNNPRAGASEDGLVMQGAHCRASGMVIVNASRHGVLMQPLTSIDNDTAIAEDITVVEHGQQTTSSAGFQLGLGKPSGDMAHARLAGTVTSQQASTIGGGVSTSVAQGNVEQLDIDIRAVVQNRGLAVAPSHTISIDRINVRGSYEQQATAAELLFFNSASANEIENVNINCESLVGGTVAIRNNSDRVTAIRALALEVSGQSGNRTTGANISLRIPNGVATVNGDSTPSVAGIEVLVVQATTATLSDLDDGGAGQTVKVIFDTSTTVDFTGTNLNGNQGVDWSATSGDHMICTTDDGTTWYCAVSDNTA